VLIRRPELIAHKMHLDYQPAGDSFAFLRGIKESSHFCSILLPVEDCARKDPG
jgi:hypothetical protein